MGKFTEPVTCHMSHFLIFTHFAPLNENTLICKTHEPKHNIQQCFNQGEALCWSLGE